MAWPHMVWAPTSPAQTSSPELDLQEGRAAHPVVWSRRAGGRPALLLRKTRQPSPRWLKPCIWLETSVCLQTAEPPACSGGLDSGGAAAQAACLKEPLPRLLPSLLGLPPEEHAARCWSFATYALP